MPDVSVVFSWLAVVELATGFTNWTPPIHPILSTYRRRTNQQFVVIT